MNEELNALAEILWEAGWRSPNDAQWTRLEAAIPDIRDALSHPAPSHSERAVPDGWMRDVEQVNSLKQHLESQAWGMSEDGPVLMDQAYAMAAEALAVIARLAAAPASPAATGWVPVGEIVEVDDGQWIALWRDGTPEPGTVLYAAPSVDGEG